MQVTGGPTFPSCSSGSRRQRQEVPPIRTIPVVLFCLTLLVVCTLFSAGFIILTVEYTQCANQRHLRHGIVCILGSGIVLMLAWVFGVFRVCEDESEVGTGCGARHSA
ncbi:hypothetical protein MRX96_000563 [Rhipicephalus microplus]